MNRRSPRYCETESWPAPDWTSSNASPCRPTARSGNSKTSLSPPTSRARPSAGRGRLQDGERLRSIDSRARLAFREGEQLRIQPLGERGLFGFERGRLAQAEAGDPVRETLRVAAVHVRQDNDGQPLVHEAVDRRQ